MTDIPMTILQHAPKNYWGSSYCSQVSHRAGACGACCLTVNGRPPYERTEDSDGKITDEIVERFRRDDPRYYLHLQQWGPYGEVIDEDAPQHGQPCPLLDNDPASDTYRCCTQYERRPLACSSFEVGNEVCTHSRFDDGARPSYPMDEPPPADPPPPPDIEPEPPIPERP